MNYKIVLTHDFKIEFKNLLKKYISLKVAIEELSKSQELNPAQGTPIGKKLLQNSLCYPFQKCRKNWWGNRDASQIVAATSGR